MVIPSSSNKPGEAKRLRGGHWPSGLVSLQWLCGRDDVLFDLEKGQEIDDGRTASGVALALQVQQSPSAPVIRPHIKSSQPTYHPTMVALVVKKECEVERIRGGCFPCRNGKVEPSFGGSSSGQGITIDKSVPERVMQLAPETRPTAPEQPISIHPQSSSQAANPTRSRPPSQPTELPMPKVTLQVPDPSRQRATSHILGPKKPAESSRQRRASHA